MAEKLLLPKMGASMEEGTIDNWLVDEGEKVEAGDPVVEVQTDKITIEVEAENDGILLKKLYDPGDIVPVQQVIAFIGEEGENVDDIMEDVGEEVSGEESKSENIESIFNKKLETGASSGDKVDTISIRRTPIARRLAEENDVSLEEVSGSGPLGRIQKRDIENYFKTSQKKITPLAQKMATDFQVDTSTIAGSGTHGKIIKDDIISTNRPNISERLTAKRVDFKGMRKIIAQRISDSFYSAPHVTLNSEVDMTECVTLRKKLLSVIEELESVRLSYNEIIVKATAFALRNNPNINISLKDEKEIVYHPDVNIGIAVAVPDGLVVPVLRNVDEKGLGTLAKEAKAIAKKAMDGSLTSDEMQGSTFSISNLGMYAIDGFTPIINQPNAAILGVGRIQKKSVIVDDEVAVRSMMALSLSFDHRIIDGAPAAQFLTDLKDVLENPYKLMV
ncbi:pyruvate dehydrogenase E2 component (dihydrolipoamide acetyltransferase) [Virgibacillus halotolerans]|uniref:dihydrolipoamide acetyltransferase family protein n=1 Tax=Virgibacillus halotolerans TaxID=1071053 RepID=UPI0019614397|nr:dihydrolipoamide acetyltransferase family protein [Virgibacillus halotolerans]MBM7599468.1 pyruvate dehydrogenase E2 component (dihydrolipoamide acetyltransferase) [Virgibacillus halotolerans]